MFDFVDNSERTNLRISMMYFHLPYIYSTGYV